LKTADSISLQHSFSSNSLEHRPVQQNRATAEDFKDIMFEFALSSTAWKLAMEIGSVKELPKHGEE